MITNDKSSWEKLTAQERDHLKFALHNAITDPKSEYYGLNYEDLQWRIDKYGAIHVRKKVEI